MDRYLINLLWYGCKKGEYGIVSGADIANLSIEDLEELALYRVILGKFKMDKSTQPDELLQGGEVKLVMVGHTTIGIFKNGTPMKYLPKQVLEQFPIEDILKMRALGSKGPIVLTASQRAMKNYYYVISRYNLIGFIANKLDLTYKYSDVPPNGIQIGTYKGTHPVVLLTRVNDQRIVQALEIKRNLLTGSLILLTTENIRLSEAEKKRLYKEHVIFLSTLALLPPDIRPRWDLVDFSICSLGDDDFKYSPDYRTIYWNGREYALTAMQAACIQVLHQCHEKGTGEVSQAYVLDTAGSNSGRLSDIFSRTPLWKTLITPGERKGAYRLNIS